MQTTDTGSKSAKTLCHCSPQPFINVNERLCLLTGLNVEPKFVLIEQVHGLVRLLQRQHRKTIMKSSMQDYMLALHLTCSGDTTSIDGISTKNQHSWQKTTIDRQSSKL